MHGLDFVILFFVLPIFSLIFFIISLCRYIAARRKIKVNAAAFTESDIKARKILLIISSVILGVFLLVFVGFIALMYLAISFM